MESQLQNNAWGDMRRIVVVAGNGLSVAANHKLELSSLTEEILLRLQSRLSIGPEYADALRAIAKRHTEFFDTNFEELVGALHHQNATLATLDNLALVAKSGDLDLRDAIAKTNSFVSRMSDIGIAVILQTIDELASEVSPGNSVIGSFIGALMDTDFDKVDIANLNYDSILLTSLVATLKNQLLDMGDGRSSSVRKIRLGKHNINAITLRKNWADVPARRFRLLHLHGSTLFWRDPGELETVKIRNSDLRDHALFNRILRKTIPLRPVVVLTNTSDKGQIIKEEPFRFAYQSFQKSLESANHLLIVGYSFRDNELNRKLALEIFSRGADLKILVVSKGKQVNRSFIIKTLSESLDKKVDLDFNLSVFGRGIEALDKSQAWVAFKTTN